MTIPPGCDEASWEEDDLLQCAGAARFRRNVSKLPRNPQVAVAKFRSPTIFRSSREFLEHHTGFRGSRPSLVIIDELNED